MANIKGLSPGRVRDSGRPEFNSEQWNGSISLVPAPAAQAVAGEAKVDLGKAVKAIEKAEAAS